MLGYADYFEPLTELIYNEAHKKVCEYVQIETNGKYRDNKEDVINSLVSSGKISEYGFMDDLVINKQQIENVGINDVDEIVINFIFVERNLGAFSWDGSEIDENGFKSMLLALNFSNMYLDGKTEMESVIHHELTHAYSLYQRYKKNGVERTENYLYNSNVTDANNNNINKILYGLSQDEINSCISEISYYLKKNINKVNTKKDCWNLINSRKEFQKLKIMDMMIEELAVKPNVVKRVMNWIDENPDKLDIFPSKKGYSLQAYQRRLIRAAKDKRDKMFNKIDRYIEILLYKKKNGEV